MNRIRLAVASIFGIAFLANEKTPQEETLLLGNQLSAPPKEGEHWVQLSPFGDFANSAGRTRVIQRLEPKDALTICNAFNKGMGKTRGQPLGMPFYEGHPDHPVFKGQPGHTDPKSYGRGVKMEVRQDANCALCNAFANSSGDNEAEPCPEHGLFVKMDWNEEGRKLLSNQAFHGHSVNWGAVPDGKEGDTPIYRPVVVKSVGFTNQPNIPVKPASLANATADEGGKVIVPPWLKLLAGYKEDDDCTMEDCQKKLEKATVNMAANADLSAFYVNESPISHDSPPKGYPEDKGEYADPKNYKYPVDTAERTRAAWSYIHKAKNRGGYSAEELSAIEGRIKGAAKKHGVEISSDDAANAMVIAICDGFMLANAKGDEEKDLLKTLHEKLGTDPKGGKEAVMNALDQHVKDHKTMEAVRNTRKELEKASGKHAEARQKMEADCANAMVDILVKSGRITVADAPAILKKLKDAGENFANVALSIGYSGQRVHSANLSRGNLQLLESERERTQKFNELMVKRQQQFPNEEYDARYIAVMNSADGQQLFAQMSRPGKNQ